RDEVFDAIEDLIIATDVTTSAGSQLSDDLSDAVTAPAARLAKLFAATPGDGPLGELAAAADDLITAARPYEATWPATLATVIATAQTALAPIRRGGRARPRSDETTGSR